MKVYADKLLAGETVTFKPRGNSMTPRVMSGQEVTVVPVQGLELEVGDVVLCRVSGNYYLHLIKAIDKTRGYQIGNNHGRINGWTHTIFGKALL